MTLNNNGETNVDNVAEELGRKLLGSNLVLTTAESCTGGWVSKMVTDIPGSSAWYDRGFVTYSNEAKSEMLGIDEEALRNFGAVSEQIVQAMAQGALTYSRADVAIATSGIAGPDGGANEKPVGLVCFAWIQCGAFQVAESRMFTGNRERIRLDASIYALRQLLRYLGR